jgi:hypothetical protein
MMRRCFPLLLLFVVVRVDADCVWQPQAAHIQTDCKMTVGALTAPASDAQLHVKSSTGASIMRIEGAADSGVRIKATSPSATSEWSFLANSFSGNSVGTVPIGYVPNGTATLSFNSLDPNNAPLSQLLLTAGKGVFVKGLGQATPTPKVTAGSANGGAFFVQDIGGGYNNGGLLVFGAYQGYFAAIKGLMYLGGGGQYSTGRLEFLTRRETGDEALTPAMYIDNNQQVGIGMEPAGTKLVVKGSARFWAEDSIGAGFAEIVDGPGTDSVILRLAGSSQLDVGGEATFGADVTVNGNISAKYQDVAEWVPSTESLTAGTVVVLDRSRSNHVIASTHPYDTRVAGVVSARPGLVLGERADNKALIATTGRVRMRVDATQHPIEVGDLLVTADKPGFAMKSMPVDLQGLQIHRPGTVVGKALEPLARGQGEILVLLTLQ